MLSGFGAGNLSGLLRKGLGLFFRMLAVSFGAPGKITHLGSPFNTKLLGPSCNKDNRPEADPSRQLGPLCTGVVTAVTVSPLKHGHLNRSTQILHYLPALKP